MPGVKSGSSLRAEQAAETRRRILAAAAAVIVEQGFAGARIGDVAARAAVAAPTVYKVFSNKRSLLMGALTAAMTGTADTAAIDSQAWWAEQLEEPDAARQLRLIARNARRIYERAGALLEALRAAAPGDTELAAAWQNIIGERLARSRRSASALAAKAGQRARLSKDDTALTLWSLTGPELFAAYTSTGKSPVQYEQWLGDILCRTLIN